MIFYCIIITLVFLLAAIGNTYQKQTVKVECKFHYWEERPGYRLMCRKCGKKYE